MISKLHGSRSSPGAMEIKYWFVPRPLDSNGREIHSGPKPLKKRLFQ